MMLSTGKRIGQSGQELLTASVFSFVLHACVVAAVALLYISSAPKAYLPPFYSVKLVGLPAEGPGSGGAPQAAAPAPAAPAPPPVQHPAKPAPTPAPPPKRATSKQHRLPAVPPKSGMPELSKATSKPEKRQPETPVEQPREHAASAPVSVSKAGTAPGTGSAAGTGSGTGTGTGTGVKGQGVAVAPTSQGFKDSWYLDLVRDKIAQNWRPSPDAPDARVRVIFRVNRSGWVDASATKVDEAESKCTYAFKLAGMRAIQTSNPFPPLPEDFSKQALEFSVDLTPNE